MKNKEVWRVALQVLASIITAALTALERLLAWNACKGKKVKK